MSCKKPQRSIVKNENEESIPGWLDRGEFIEIIWDEGKIAKTKRKIQV